METSNVRLVSTTQGVGGLNGEEMIAYVARVSNPANQNNMETASRLLKYLIKNRHWSPFEMVHMTVEIETSRGIAQQILRHRSFAFQEFSQRYAEVTEFINYPARRQDDKNRQNSIDDLSEEVKEWFDFRQRDVQDYCGQLYKEALEMGIAKEQARFLLPIETKTKLYMSGSIRSWIHYIDLRSSNGTQLEHREIALKCRDILKQHFPSVAEAMEW